MAKKALKENKQDNKLNKQSFLERYAFTVGLILFIAAISFAAVFSFAQKKNSSRSLNKADCPVSECVSLYSQSASPDTITVTVGSFVQFNSSDGKKHNISLAHSVVQHEDASEYESGDFEADEAWKVQFKKDGAFTFRDKYNDRISVNVIVYTPGKDYKIQ